MNTISCDLCGNEFYKWPDIILTQADAQHDGVTVIPAWHVADIHLHHECFLSLGLIHYSKDPAGTPGVTP